MGQRVKISDVPFASVIAAVMGVISISVFAGTMYEALKIFTVYIFEDLFHYRLSWLETIQDTFLIIAITMALYVVFLLVFGVLVTGATRRHVYGGMSCIMGGQTSAIFLMVLTYICHIIWILIISACIIPILLYVMFIELCNQHVFNKKAEDIKFCMDLSNFGIFSNSSQKIVGGLTTTPLCSPTNLRRMCTRTEESGQLFIVAYIGAFCASLAMAHFMTILAANYTRMKLSKELTDYRNAVEMTS
ncbi:membrane glycoprotein M6-a-like [Octopus vulgaris]|uniref:Membrane glycoprotein M6-a-like n=1 Tax=Octopus vulgaris TaxID=6645 RepID=A0AA36BD43_OCTVU|nr:membrane glycoprotein M6-a-like [Octopus vulgaris]